MDETFKVHLETLEPTYRRLISMEASKMSDLPKDIPTSGIYMLFENGQSMFVGRSNRMRTRLMEQCRPSSNHFTAPLAFKIARKETGKTDPSYTTNGSRTVLENDPIFKKAFARAKERVRNMDVKCFPVRDSVRQCLLQIYVALASKAKYNDFDTH